MAEVALKKLEEQLKCSICFDTYTDPKLLQCFHVFCQGCLVRLVRDQQGQLTLTCPLCRQVTPVPARGVAGIQSAFHINHLLEIQDSVKIIKDSPATQKEEGHPENLIRHCSEHTEEELKLYCETCEALICWKCVIKGGKHQSHYYELLKEAYERFKGEITSSLEPMKEQLTATNNALAQIDTRSGEISDQRAAIEADIHATARRLHEVLDIRSTELIGDLHHITQGKLKSLASQRDQVETTQAQLSSSFHFMRESLKPGSEGDVLMMKRTLLKQVHELTEVELVTFKPNAEADTNFSAATDITAVCESYGQISTKSLPDPSKCHAVGKGVEVAAIGEISTVSLQVVNFKGKPCEEPLKSLECELTSEMTSARTRGTIARQGPSKYEISYQPTIKGRHMLHIKIRRRHVKGSPFKVAVKSSVKKFGRPILTIAGVDGPLGVAINQMGEVVVVEQKGHCISVFSPRGEKIRSFGTHGSSLGQFISPCFVAVDCGGNILVTDKNNHRIQKFTAQGHFLAAVGAMGTKQLQFRYPRGIALNPHNNKVYLSDLNHRVQVLNSNLTFSGTFGKEGSGKGNFNCPWGIAHDSTGKVYIADSSNHRIQVFTAEGKFLKTFGRRGEELYYHQGKGELDFPVGITVDSSGLVYVSENNLGVTVFTSEGEFVTSVKWKGQAMEPSGLAVDDNGVVYVCDYRNNCIVVL